jgi:hypothetical protein
LVLRTVGDFWSLQALEGRPGDVVLALQLFAQDGGVDAQLLRGVVGELVALQRLGMRRM